MFWSASASRAASGTMCSPDRSTRPEKRPSKKASARFSVSRSGNVIVTICELIVILSGLGTQGIHGYSDSRTDKWPLLTNGVQSTDFSRAFIPRKNPTEVGTLNTAKLTHRASAPFADLNLLQLFALRAQCGQGCPRSRRCGLLPWSRQSSATIATTAFNYPAPAIGLTSPPKLSTFG